MVLPNLIHPVDVVVEQIDKSATIYDPDAREPIQAAARSVSFTIKGQVKFDPAPGGPGAAANLELLATGPNENAVGYVLFRKFDLDNHATGPKVINIGDRVLADGHLAGEFYVVRLQWRGHYPDQNGPSLLKAWFQDRKPSKTRAG